MPRALSRPCTAPPPRYTTYPCIHVDLPPPPGSSCMVLRRCIPFGAWPWEYMPRGMAMGIHATCAALSLLPTASLVATQLSSGLSALPVFAPHLFSLQCPPYRTVAAPQQRRPRSGANGWHCRLPGANLRQSGANLLQSPPTWSQSPRCGCCSRAQLCRRRRRRSRRRQSRQTRCRSRRSSSSTRAHA
jgi:hypothetical protein